MAGTKRQLHSSATAGKTLPKCPTGISGLDEITGGGFAAGPADADLRVGGMREEPCWRWNFWCGGSWNSMSRGCLFRLRKRRKRWRKMCGRWDLILRIWWRGKNW